MTTLLTAMRRRRVFKSVVLALLAPCLVTLPSAPLRANPAGGVVVNGLAEIGEGLDGHLSILQHSDKAIINWESFSIAPGELTQFLQPGANSAALNRVVTGNPSAIHGALQANGNLFLINPNGIVVGPGGSVDVNGFVASTLNISDANFLAGGDLLFSGVTEAGVQNFGRINAVGGDVFLVGKTVTNSGSITAANGLVGLAAGQEVLISAAPDANGERVFVRPTGGAGGVGIGVDNSGIISGAAVELKAHGNMYALAINNSGSIRATGVLNQGGSVFLRAEGGQIDNTGVVEATLPNGDGGRVYIDAGIGGIVNAGGTISADAAGGGSGGSVTILGEEINVLGGAQISADGELGGGVVQIGADPISGAPNQAEASRINVASGSRVSASGGSGDGGRVYVGGATDSVVDIAGQLNASSISGNGGTIEVLGGDVTVAPGSFIDASGGSDGGGVTITADGELMVHGIVLAKGLNGNGGSILLNSDNGNTTVSSSAQVDASGGGNGGVIRVDGGVTTIDGSLSAVGGTGRGGQVVVEGNEVAIGSTAAIDASGATGGGVVALGGGFRGQDSNIRNSQKTTVAAGAQIKADATSSGNGGVVVVWSDGDTLFQGDISAQGINAGGFVEVSGKQNLGFHGAVNTLAANGVGGTLLLDPQNGTISSGADNPVGNNFNINNVNLSAALDQGNNVIITTDIGGSQPGNLVINDIVEWYQEDDTTTPGTLTLLANGNITFNDSVRSAGTGGINIVAGWDGSTGLTNGIDTLTLADADTSDPSGIFDISAILATMNDGDVDNDAAGRDGGSVFIGRTASTVYAVNVGSRYGDTNLAAHDLIMKGSNSNASGAGNTGERYTQLGFRDTGYEYELATANANLEKNEWWGNAAGNVRGKDYITDLGGTRLDDGKFDGAGSGATGDINVELSGRLEMRTSDDNRGYAQIGHGGSARQDMEVQDTGGSTSSRPTLTTRDGITMDSGDTNYQFFGTTWRTNTEATPDNASLYIVDSDINIHVGEDVFINADDDPIDDVTDTAGADGSTGMYVQIGHGGDENVGSYHGNITVIAEGTRGSTGVGIEMRSGNGSSRYAQIGHGSNSEGNRRYILDQRTSGDITVRAETGAVRMIGYNLVPDVDENTALPAGSGLDSEHQYSPIQIGHGGAYAAQATTGTPNMSSHGNIQVFAGGVYTDATYGDLGIQVQAGNQQAAYAMIGNGGYNLRANTGSATGFTGNIEVIADKGSIRFAGGEEKRSQRDWGYGYNFVQIGNGGYNVDGNFEGSITVSAGQGAGATGGDIIFDSGRMRQSFAQIGHGGSESQGIVTGDGTSPISVTALNDITFTSRPSAPSNAYGLSTDYQNNWNSEAARIDGNHPEANIRNRAWDTSIKFAHIGHGGNNSNLSSTNNDLSVIAQNGDIVFTGGDGNRDFIMIGGGGWEDGTDRNISGNILVSAANGDIIFDASNGGAPEYFRTYVGYETITAGQGLESFAMIGNGGYDYDGDHSGSITVTAGGNLHMIGPNTNTTIHTVSGFTGNKLVGYDSTVHSYTMLEEASQQSRTFFLSHGNVDPGTFVIDVNANPDVVDSDNGDGTGKLMRGTTQVGTINYVTGEVTFTAKAQTTDSEANKNIDYKFDGGTSVNDERTIETDSSLRPTEAFLGHGALVPGTVTIVIDADGSGGGRIVLTDPLGDGNLRTSNGQSVASIDYNIGRVRFNTVVNTAGDEVEASYSYTEGNSDRAFVQIGNGGYGSTVGNAYSTGQSGKIAVTAGGDIRFHGGAFDGAYAQLGHGGSGTQGQHGQDPNAGDGGLIDVSAGGVIEFLAGRGLSYYDNEAYTQLGHGGRDGDGRHQGNINVTSGSGVASLAPGVIGGGASTQGLIFTAGVGREAYAQLGHGGYGAESNTASGSGGEAGLIGDISISTDGDVRFTAGTLLSNFYDYDDGRVYTQLGHGGYDSDTANGTGANGRVAGHLGDIEVMSQSGGIYFSAGDHDASGLGEGYGILHYAQLGHGGYGSNGSHSGDITATAATDIIFTGGERTHDDSGDKRNWAQLGHGGDSTAGNFGTLNPNGYDTHTVTAGGDIIFTAGEGRRSVAQLGNGGYGARGDSAANLNLNAGGDVLFTAGVGTETGHAIFNETSREIDASTYEMGWAPLRYRGINSGSLIIAIDGDVTDGGDFIDDGSGNLIDPDGVLGTPGAIVGKVNYSSGHVRFDVAIDAAGTGVISRYTTGSGSSLATRNETAGVNGAMDLAANSGPNVSLAGIAASFNSTRGGIVNVQEETGTLDQNIGILAGSFTLTLPDGTVITDSDLGGGSGQLIRDGNPADVVGNIDYVNGFYALTEVINPTGQAGVSLDYQVDRGIGSDLSFAQLGNGGYEADNPNNAANNTPGNTGDIHVKLDGDLRFQAGDGNYGYAQLGNGGALNKGAHSGNITIEGLTGTNSGGVVEFLGGTEGKDTTDLRGYAQLGHGGYDADGNHFGNITIRSGSDLSGYGVNFRGGNLADNYVQLGHGGRSARSGTSTEAFGLNGAIYISTVGDVNFVAGTKGAPDTSNEDARIYAQLGHGGYDADHKSDGSLDDVNDPGYTPEGHHGDITVISSEGDINFLGGDATRNGSEGDGTGQKHYAQLGHGGYDARGDHYGNITVEATQGNINFIAGSTTDNTAEKYNYAQLGHGGAFARGDLGRAGETISVKAGGDINFASGDGNNSRRSYAQLGHGGYDADNPNPGYYPDDDPLNPDRGPTDAERVGNTADIIVESVNGSVLFTAGASVDSYIQLGHGGITTDGDHVGNITVYADRDGSSSGVGGDVKFDASEGTSGGHYGHLGHGGNLASGGHTGNIMVDASGEISFLAGVGSSYVQLGHGGRNDHRLTRGGNSTAGYTYNNNNDRYYAGTHTGDITVHSGDDITFTAGHTTGDTAFAQIGHGGFRNAAEENEGHTGAIEVISGGAIAFSAGERNQTYAQIGHGGYEAFGNHGIVLEARSIAGDNVLDGAALAGDGTEAFLGQAYQVGKIIPGSVVITVDPSVTAVVYTDDGSGKIVDGSDTQVGWIDYSTGRVFFMSSIDPGGDGTSVDYEMFEVVDDSSSTILVEAVGDIEFTAGTVGTRGDQAYAQIGHGGATADFSATRTITDELAAQSTLTTTTAYHLNTPTTTPVGTAGDVTVRTTGTDSDIRFTTGADTDNYAQIGNGGRANRGDHRGDVTVEATGDVEFLRNDSLQSATNVTVSSTTGSNQNVGSDFDWAPGSVTVTVDADGSNGGPFVFDDDGLGGLIDTAGAVSDPGTKVATIDYDDRRFTWDGAYQINPSSDTVTADYQYSQNLRSYAQIGNGGQDSDNENGRMMTMGHTGNISVTAGGDVRMHAGQHYQSYAQIGNGGYDTEGASSGSIDVHAGGLIEFLAGQGYTTNSDGSYAQIGHGGYSSSGAHTGDINISAGDNSGGLFFKAGDVAGNYVQIGHGGLASKAGGNQTLTDSDFGAAAGFSGSITINAVGDVTFLGGTGKAFEGTSDGDLYAMVGHGGYDADTTESETLLDPAGAPGHTGDISVTSSQGNISFQAGDTAQGSLGEGFGRFHFTQLGHGGYESIGNHSGNITVEATLGSITFRGGSSTDNTGDRYNYAQLGHGGAVARGDHGKDGELISVLAGGDINFLGGGPLGNRSYAQLGHGGIDSDNPNGGAPGDPGNQADIMVVSTGGDINFTGGSAGVAYAQLGHGGYATNGDHSGNITVQAESGSINFTGGTSGTTYTQLGHGGREASGNHTGNILVEALGGGLSFLASTTSSESYAHLGHGGRSARGDYTGNIEVNALNDILFTGGAGSQDYAMLGHGGYDADNPSPSYYPDDDPLNPDRGPTAAERVGNTGNITVRSTNGSIGFTAGTANNTSAQLGHGGVITDGDHTGNITVEADIDKSHVGSGGGNITFDASPVGGSNHYAQLGHGGYLASGGHTGNISVEAGAKITFTGGRSNAYVQLGHGGKNDHRVNRGGSSGAYTYANANDRYYAGTHTGDITVHSGDNITFTAGTTSGDGMYAQIGHGGFRNAAEAEEGHTGAIEVISGGAIAFTAGDRNQTYVQIGHGGYEAFGNHGIVLQAQNVTGDTVLDAAALAGDGTEAFLGSAYTVGKITPGSVTITVDPSGTPVVYTDDGAGKIVDAGSTQVGWIEYSTGRVFFTTSIDAGGAGTTVDYDLYEVVDDTSSTILVEAADDITFSAGTNPARGDQAYAHIGHGGATADFSATRTITDELAAQATLTTTTAYHLNLPKTTPVGAAGDVTVRTTGADADITFTAGADSDTYVQIGNGGRANRGDHRGDVTVEATGDVEFLRVDPSTTLVTISNQNVSGVSGNVNLGSDVDLLPGSLTITVDGDGSAGGPFVFQDDGQGQLIDTAGAVAAPGTVVAIIRYDVRRVDFNASYNINPGSDTVQATYQYTNAFRNYAQIGNGGHDSDNENARVNTTGHTGNISVDAGGDIRMHAGNHYQAYAQLGNGGYDTEGASTGSINVSAGGIIEFLAGLSTSTNSEASYAQLGHGGYGSSGTHSGDISVTAGDNGGGLFFKAGDTVGNYVQLGHGGFAAKSGGNQTLTDADYGAPAGYSGSITVESEGDITFLGGTVRQVEQFTQSSPDGAIYAQLGHGGYDSDTTENGALEDPNTVVNIAGHSGDISVTSSNGDINFSGGSVANGSAGDGYGRIHYTQLGHGGYGANGNHHGDIAVEATSGEINFKAGSSTDNSNEKYNYAQLGHGGAVARGDHGLATDLISVTAGSDINFMSGDGNNSRRSYAQLGNGGFETDNPQPAAPFYHLNPDGTGLVGPTAAEAVGHQGDIFVESVDGSITFTAGASTDYSYIQIGHGGGITDGDHSGNITVYADKDGSNAAGGGGNLTFDASEGTQSTHYGHLGHGGYNSSGDMTGDIDIQTGGAITFTASRNSYVKIGHGGRNDHVVNNGTGGVSPRSNANDRYYASTLSGNIGVMAGGDITFTYNAASTGSTTGNLQIGHGGFRYAAKADEGHNGDISVVSGGLLTFAAGNRSQTMAQIGHGGYEAFGNHSGDIYVQATDGVVLTATTGTSGADQSYAQIGHGGYDADFSTTRITTVEGAHGDPNPSPPANDPGNADNELISATGTRYHLNIPIADPGGNMGNITVLAGVDGSGNILNGGASITVTGGNEDDAYAQIGHGGRATSGSHSGTIVVRAAEDISLSAGQSAQDEAFGQIGHGGMGSQGDHSGDITVEAAADGSGGKLTVLAGTNTDNYAQIGNGGRQARGDHSGNITLFADGDIMVSAGTGSNAYAMVGNGGYDADSQNPSYYQDNDPLNPDRGPTPAERVGNSGNISVVSLNGSIGFNAGSANNTSAQLGHGGLVNDGDNTGNIYVRADEDGSNLAGGGGNLIFDGSINTGGNHYVQLGHGGYLSSGGHTGDIDVAAGGEVQFLGGRSNAYAQLGHGGKNDHRANRGGSGGNYTYSNGNDRYYAGTHTGDITVHSGSDITFNAGTSAGDTSYAQLGHGGFRNAAEANEGHTGAIEVISGGAIAFSAGDRNQTYVQIGHGGYEAFGNHGIVLQGQTITGDIALNTVAQAGDGSEAFLGNGLQVGKIIPGSVIITVDPSGSAVEYHDNGAGEIFNSANSRVGFIEYSTGRVFFISAIDAAGDGTAANYDMFEVVDDSSSTITVEAVGDITFTAGTNPTRNDQSYAQIGHGGATADFNAGRVLVQEIPTAQSAITASTAYHLNTPVTTPVGTAGDITVRTTGTDSDIRFTTGPDSDNYGQIGNGGRGTRGDHRGNITVEATGDVEFLRNESVQSISNVTVSSTTGNNQNVGSDFDWEVGSVVVTVDADGSLGTPVVFLDDGNGGLIDVSGAVSTAGTKVATIDYDDRRFSWDANYQINPLGEDVRAAYNYSQAFRSYAQIGNGGHDSDNENGRMMTTGHTGNISVTAGGDVRMHAGHHYQSYAQIGNGGYDTEGAHTGDIDVHAGGIIEFLAGLGYTLNSDGSYAQLGHGGYSSSGAHSGNINVSAGDNSGGLLFVGGDTAGNYVQLGHGGYAARSGGHQTVNNIDHGAAVGFTGSITVDAVGSITFLGGTTKAIEGNTDGIIYAQLGHGGYDADTTQSETLQTAATAVGHSGDISVTSTMGDINFMAGSLANGSHGEGLGRVHYTQLGHGGYEVYGNHTGNIDVEATLGDIGFRAGSSTDNNNERYNYAQLGHGGANSRGDHGLTDETIAVTAGGDVTFTAGDGVRSYAQLGSGGYDTDNPNSGNGTQPGINANITVNAGGKVSFVAGDGDDAYAQLGNGGRASRGGHTGTISVEASGGFDLLGGAGLRAYAQAGHGGHASPIVTDYAISILGGGEFNIIGGTGDQAYVQVGHGGQDSDGDKAGDITVRSTTGGLRLISGGSDAYAMIGHGGLNVDGTKSGNIEASGMGGDLIIQSGSDLRSLAQVGHGGEGATTPPTGTISGDIFVTGGTSVQVLAGTGDTTPARIGHGEAYGELDVNSGDIYVEALAGSVILTAASVDDFNYSQIGHGGAYSGVGDKTGSIEVVASQDVNLNAGAANNAWAQIGHGGKNADNLTLGTPEDADPNVATMDFIKVTAGNDVNLLAAGTSSTDDSYAQIGNGGYSSSGAKNSHVIVVAGNDITLQGAATGDRGYAQIGNGGALASGDMTGDIFVHAGNNLTLTRGAGGNAYAKIGLGDHMFLGASGSGLRDGDIQVSAGENLTSTGGLIGHADTRFSGAQVAAGSSTYIAVSRNDPTATGTGVLLADAGTAFTSSATGELRFYLPSRSSNQMAAGTLLNGTPFVGSAAEADPQRADEFFFSLSEHENLADSVDLEDYYSGATDGTSLERWQENLETIGLTQDTANYSTALGNYSLYLDAAAADTSGSSGTGGTGGTGSGGGTGDSGTGGDTGTTGDGGTTGGATEDLLAEAIDSLLAGISGGSEVVTITLPDGTEASVLVENLLVVREGVVGFAPGIFAENWIPIGTVVSEEFLDDFLNSDQSNNLGDSFGNDTVSGWGEPGLFAFFFGFAGTGGENGSSPYSSFLVFGDDANGIHSPVIIGIDNSADLLLLIQQQISALGFSEVFLNDLLNRDEEGDGEGDGDGDGETEE